MNNHVKGVIVVAVMAGLMWLGWAKYSDFLAQGSKPTKGTQILNKMEKEGVPDFSLKDIDGKDVALADYSDKLVIVNFWASWCDPCVAEFPSLIKLIETYKGKVVLLAVSADHNMEDMTSFLKAFRADNPYIKVMWDKDKKVAEIFGTSVLPESYIIGKNGKLIRKIAGVDDWAKPEALEFFQNLIEHEGIK